MSYRQLPLTCECGEVPDRILEVGFTAGHELVIHCWCSECHRALYLSRPLADCWRECPKPDSVPQAPASGEFETTAADAQFLQSIGIECLEVPVGAC